MKRVVGEQRLGFVATVCPNGTPNLSPKGTTAVWDDDHLVFANIRSPGTLANLRQNPNVEVNVVDQFAPRHSIPRRTTSASAKTRCAPSGRNTGVRFVPRRPRSRPLD
jgi:hypothetical protein